MTAMEQGACVVEDAVRARAQAQGVAITRLSWNGDEGLKARQTLQTLLVGSAQSGSRASFTRDQLSAAAGGELPEAVRCVVDRLVEDLHALSASGISPLGGSG